jgi:hypothetical protein
MRIKDTPNLQVGYRKRQPIEGSVCL